MSYHNYPPIIMLNGKNQRLELYTDRIIVRPTSWRARLGYGGATMLYLDEITDVAVCPVRFEPEAMFRVIITGCHQVELYADYSEAEYAAANFFIDQIEHFVQQGELIPPVS